MKCAVCKHGNTNPGTSSILLSRKGVTLVFRDVPANICDNCGEEYFTDQVTASLLKAADAAANRGVELEIQKFAA